MNVCDRKPLRKDTESNYEFSFFTLVIAVFLLSLATRLNESENLEELECVGVTLWAVTANSEKGKVAAKRAKCTAALTNTIQRLLMKQHLLATGEPSASALSALISLLDKVSTVQNSNNNNDHNNSFM